MTEISEKAIWLLICAYINWITTLIINPRMLVAQYTNLSSAESGVRIGFLCGLRFFFAIILF